MLVHLKGYHRPSSLEEAVRILQEGRGRTAVLAGGTELVGKTDHALETVIDLASLNLGQIVATGGALRLGAMTTLAALTTDPAVLGTAGGLLARAAQLSAPATIRAAATLGGTLAGRKGGEELPTALLALGAFVQLTSRDNAVTVPLSDFLTRRAALLSGAILTGVTITATPDARGGLARVSRSPADRSIVFAAAVVAGESRSIAVGGCAATPRLWTSEQFAICPEDWEAVGDFRASAEYRTWVAPVVARRALENALGGAQA